MSGELKEYAFRFSRVRELVGAPAFGPRARLKLAYVYLTRGSTRGTVGIPFDGTTLYLDRSQLASDWETLRENYLPRKQPYLTEYEGATVLDLGGHKGFFGAWAISMGAEAVVSYEPELTNFSRLAATAAQARAGGKRWEVHRAAVARSPGERTLYVSEESWTHSLLPPAVVGDGEGHGTQLVEAVAIGEVLAAAREASPQRLVVKVDVEGAEQDLIVGDSSWALADEIFCEAHDLASRDAVVASLGGLGFVQVRDHEQVLHLKRSEDVGRAVLARA